MLTDTEKQELFHRLKNIELKVNDLTAQSSAASAALNWSGHLDQAFGHITFAQFGEDLIVANIFSLLGIFTPSYIDIGAHHPLNVSNTALLHIRGSRGINVEANPDLIPVFRELRPDDVTVNVGVGAATGRFNFYRIDAYSGCNTFNRDVAEAFTQEHPQFKISDVLELEVLPLDDIIRHYSDGIYPDFLTIDVEGLDYDVLSAANFSGSKPKVICVEAVSGADSDDSSRLLHLLNDRGYELYTRTLGNLILVDSKLSVRLRD